METKKVILMIIMLVFAVYIINAILLQPSFLQTTYDAPPSTLSLSSSASLQPATGAQEQDPVTKMTFPSCTQTQLETIAHQLPADQCKKTSRKPWLQQCSFSYATRCPDSIWFTEMFNNNNNNNSKQTVVVPLASDDGKGEGKPFTAIYVGCNKGMDAVNTLRMASGDASVDKNVWRDTLYRGQTSITGGVCKQDGDEQFYLDKSNIGSSRLEREREVNVFCIEAMPRNANDLKRASDSLSYYKKGLTITNVAISNVDGHAFFPDTEGTLGVENKGLANCKGAVNESKECKRIEVKTLDSYVKDFAGAAGRGVVDFLSVDVEGYDWGVILGASETLKRTEYLEFEYNWMGLWTEHLFSDSVRFLKERGFICYWPGKRGHLWRITDCFLEHYDIKFWSNVACVNVEMEGTREMAERMEGMFKKTMDAGDEIKYDKYS